MLYYAFPKNYEEIIFWNNLTEIYLLKVNNRNTKTT